jgi:Fe-S cluster assembly iron-binding protein IscA
MLPLTTEVSLTEKAISRLKDIKAYGDKFLRVSVVPGGCSGMTFNAIVDDAQTGFDIVVYDFGRNQSDHRPGKQSLSWWTGD